MRGMRPPQGTAWPARRRIADVCLLPPASSPHLRSMREIGPTACPSLGRGPGLPSLLRRTSAALPPMRKDHRDRQTRGERRAWHLLRLLRQSAGRMRSLWSSPSGEAPQRHRHPHLRDLSAASAAPVRRLRPDGALRDDLAARPALRHLLRASPSLAGALRPVRTLPGPGQPQRRRSRTLWSVFGHRHRLRLQALRLSRRYLPGRPLHALCRPRQDQRSAQRRQGRDLSSAGSSGSPTVCCSTSQVGAQLDPQQPRGAAPGRDRPDADHDQP